MTMAKSLLVFTIMALVAGCSGPIQTRVDSSGTARAAPGSSFMLVEAEKLPAAHAQARSLVAQYLEARGYTQSASEADMLVAVTLSNRPADIGLSSKTSDATIDITPPKRQELLQSCKDREYRLGIAVTRISDGASVHRASASEYHCKASLTDSLPALVEAVLGDWGAPRGPRVEQRFGRE